MRAEIQRRLQQKPFEPFRVQLPSGVTHEVRYPQFTIVGEAVFAIGIVSADVVNPKYADYSVVLAWDEISSLEPLLPARVAN